MSQSLRIVHTVSSLQVGGMEHFVLRIAAAQKQAGHQVHIVAIQPGPLGEEAERLGIPVTFLQSGKLGRVVKAALTYGKLRPQLIHVHNQTTLHYAVLGKRLTGAPVILTNHGQGKGSPRPASAQEWAQTDAVIAVSQDVADRMAGDNLGAKLQTIYNGIECNPPTETRATMRAELGLTDDQVVGIMVARIDHLKGHDTLVRAAGLLQERGMVATILVAGDGVERANREKLARELGLGPDRLRFLGFRKDVPNLLAAADFFVLPSLTEGLPLSILEAMTHSLPTVATPVGGIPEVLRDGEEGLLVPVEDPPALADALTRMIEDKALRERLGAAAYRRATEVFSFDTMIRAYDQLYASLLKRN